jgi:hypothetical protein
MHAQGWIPATRRDGFRLHAWIDSGELGERGAQINSNRKIVSDKSGVVLYILL